MWRLVTVHNMGCERTVASEIAIFVIMTIRFTRTLSMGTSARITFVIRFTNIPSHFNWIHAFYNEQLLPKIPYVDFVPPEVTLQV